MPKLALGNTNLTAVEVKNIRRLLELYRIRHPDGKSTREIADYYGMGVESVRRIQRRDTWAHLPLEPLVTPEQQREAGEALGRKMLELQKKVDAGEISPLEIDTEIPTGRSLVQAMADDVAKQREKDKLGDRLIDELKSPGGPVSPEVAERAKSYGGKS